MKAECDDKVLELESLAEKSLAISENIETPRVSNTVEAKIQVIKVYKIANYYV